jgi:large subunit ribosomal protein L30
LNEKEKCLAVLRLRGNVNINVEFEYVFKLMHLIRKNHLTLIRSSPPAVGMIRKIKDYATWGEISQETIFQLLQKRSYLIGNQKLTERNIKERTDYDSIEKLAEVLYNNKIDLWKLSELKPIFRLHPPKGGFHGSIKKPYPKGELGYRGKKINDLIVKMI